MLELYAQQELAVGRALGQAHIALVALVYPLGKLHLAAADGAAGRGEGAVGKGVALGGVAGKGAVGDGLRHVGPGLLLLVRAAAGEYLRRVRVLLHARGHVQPGADEARVVGVAERVVRHAGLLYAEVLHGRGEGLLVLVPAGLEIVYELQVHPARYPVPVQVVDDDVLLHDALVVIAPGEEGHAVPAPGAELRERLRKGHAVGEALLVEAGELLDLVVHALEVDGLDVYLKFLPGRHVLVEAHRAYLDDLAPEMDGQPVENGGLGAHRLIPLQIHHYVIHRNTVPLFP